VFLLFLGSYLSSNNHLFSTESPLLTDALIPLHAPDSSLSLDEMSPPTLPKFHFHPPPLRFGPLFFPHNRCIRPPRPLAQIAPRTPLTDRPQRRGSTPYSNSLCASRSVSSPLLLPDVCPEFSDPSNLEPKATQSCHRVHDSLFSPCLFPGQQDP